MTCARHGYKRDFLRGQNETAPRLRRITRRPSGFCFLERVFYGLLQDEPCVTAF